MAFPAQRLQIGIIISTAMSFWDDMVNAGCLLRYLLPAMVLAQVLITLEYARAYDFPCSTISALPPALPGLIVTPAITTALLSVLITIPAGIIGYCWTSIVTTWAFSTCWHRHYPVSWIQILYCKERKRKRTLADYSHK